MNTTQQLLLPIPPIHSCHFKKCTEPVVGSSVKEGKYVCNRHNNLEWAKALTHSKDGYWKHFGQQWLRELESEQTS